MEQCNDRTVCADTDLRVDMERWHKNMRRDMRELLIDMADRQVQYYEKVRCSYVHLKQFLCFWNNEPYFSKEDKFELFHLKQL